MATAYTSSFSWSNGIAASGREGDRDRDRVRAGVSRSGFRSSRPTGAVHQPMWENVGGTPIWLGFDYQKFDGIERASDALRTTSEGAAGDLAPTQEFNGFGATRWNPSSPIPGRSCCRSAPPCASG